MEQPHPYKRRQYMINKPFQHKMILYLAVVVVAAVLISHGLAVGYAKLIALSGTASQAAAPAQAVQGWLPSLDVLWLPILITVLLGIVFVLVFGLLYSHRIAGPLFNLKRVMLRVGAGDLGTIMHIRATDEFHDVQESFNQMMEGLNQRLDAIKKGMQTLPDQERRRLERLINDNFISGPGA